MTDVQRVLKYEVAKRGPTMLPRGCELSDQRPAWIVAVGIQLERVQPHPGIGREWEDKVVVWVEVTYPYDNGNLPALELVPVNLQVVTTGREVASPGAVYVGTGQVQHDGFNNGAPLVLHVYRVPSVKITMHPDLEARLVGPGAPPAAAAAAMERYRGRGR